jgi:hypothetical protein
VFEWGGSRDANLVRYLIGLLARVGDRGSLQRLLRLAEHADFGIHAIAAIEEIEKLQTTA